MEYLKAAFTNFFPQENTVTWSERYRAALGAALGLVVISISGFWISSVSDYSPWIAASMGASAFLSFVVPSSPMAQPWAVIGGSTVSAITAIICTNLIPEVMALIPICAGLSILVMFILRCLHPPAAALALLVALNHITGFEFAFFPVFINATLLVGTAVIYNRLTGKLYPHFPEPPKKLSTLEKKDFQFQEKEIQAVLAEYDEVIDISKEDLNLLITQVEHRAHHQKLAGIQCKDIMTKDAISAYENTSFEQVWDLLHEHHIKAIPVVDNNQHVIGIVTLADFIKSMSKHLGTAANSGLISVPHFAGQAMNKTLMTIDEDKNLLDLTAIFCGHGHHHIPVVNQQNQLVGMITQSDFIRAVNQSVHID